VNGRPRPLSVVAALLRKEARVELRTFESVPAMTLFSVTTYVLFHFGLQEDSLEGSLASGVLWVTLLFASVLGINRLFVADDEQGGFDAFLLSPAQRGALLVGKATALLAYLVVVELVTVPAFALLLLGVGIGQALPDLLAVLALGDLGVAAIGTLVGALAVRTRARDLLGPLLSLPLLVPVVIAASRATTPLLSRPAAPMPAHWLLTLALYDLVFAVIAFALFDFLLED
jgi:heme exporter protein B